MTLMGPDPISPPSPPLLPPLMTGSHIGSVWHRICFTAEDDLELLSFHLPRARITDVHIWFDEVLRIKFQA